MSHYRQNFPHATVLPKMHFMEEHMIPWLKRWQVGFGLMGEQGAESIHANFNSIERSYKSIPNKVDRLRCVMHEHHLRTAPVNIALQPPAKRYKTKEE